ncbi:right-handed parallel beta-helix repeat-containing protein [Candidatus Bathyarchaeota archaeon]|nr:right-handed parallel beta-helix repeat-containing protein [Candidatus Bathyarchaeota archaeon]
MANRIVSGILPILLLIATSTLTFDIQLVKSESTTTWVVPDDHPTIQDAINNASEGDIIYVRAGVYNESLRIRKSIALIGQYPDTIIRTNRSWISVGIEAHNVVVEGFCIYNVPYFSPWGGEPPEPRWCVMISDSNNVTLCNNVISAIGNVPSQFKLGCGINVEGCNYTNIVYNLITDNFLGIGLGLSNHNLIASNVIEDSVTQGMLIVSSRNNKIYHNNFIRNAEQIICLGYENVWDDGYPSGGNYWSTYNGTDFYSGPYQNETGSDGIGDTPYVVGGNNTDTYPLMNPELPRRYRWITITGDVTHDGTIDILDIVAIASIYSCKEGDADWNREADIAPHHGIIDILDLVTCAAHYGETRKPF